MAMDQGQDLAGVRSAAAQTAGHAMSALLAKAIPYIVGLLLITGVYAGWAYHERELGAAKVEASNMAAIALQNQKDAALNKALAVKLQVRITQLESIAQAAGQKIDQEPIDPGSPADADAAAAVNCMLDQTQCVKP
jgi:uncharacterized iron-regulated protein